MAGKKGIVPSHVKKTHFSHPGIESSIIQLLEKVEDPRFPDIEIKWLEICSNFLLNSHVLNAKPSSASDAKQRDPQESPHLTGF